MTGWCGETRKVGPSKLRPPPSQGPWNSLPSLAEFHFQSELKVTSRASGFPDNAELAHESREGRRWLWCGHFLALSSGGLCLVHMDVRAPGGPHTLPAHSRGHTAALHPLLWGSKMSAVQKTLAFLWHSGDSHQMSNPITIHSMKQCGVEASPWGVALYSGWAACLHVPKRRLHCPREAASDTLQPCDLRPWWKSHLSRQR